MVSQWRTLNLWLVSSRGIIFSGNEANPRIEFARSQFELRDNREIETIRGRNTG